MRFDFITVSYEELVSNTHQISKEVFDYCNLEGSYDEDLRKSFSQELLVKAKYPREFTPHQSLRSLLMV